MDAGKPVPAKDTKPSDEVKDFVYRVSHDLRSPISTILGYAELLASDHADKLNEEGRRYLDSVRAASQQLNAMLEDLVVYSRVGRAPDPPRMGDLGTLITRARQWAADRTGFKEAVWQLPSEWPGVYGVQSELQMLFGLLLANALQHNPKPQPRIEVSWHEEPDRIVCAVRDDGPGIDRQLQQDIFRVFFRSRPQAGSRSTGMGLALAKRIAEAHDGQIWVESAPGHGATFYVAMPKKP